MMPHCSCNSQDLYIEETMRQPAPARFGTCDCSRGKLEVRRKISIPSYDACCRPSCCHLRPQVIYCPCDDAMSSDECLCYECRKFRGRSEAIIHKREELGKHKYSVLEAWFSRFDANGDGYLDVVELESLFKHLGATVRHHHSKKILKTCDIDCDGRLSFVEFVRLWQRVAYHDDFTRKIGCPELLDIVKKYNLFSDACQCQCQEYRCKHTIIATRQPLHPIKCKCGQKEKVIPFVKHEDRAQTRHRKRAAKKSLGDTAYETEDEGELPTMSMNRYNIV